MMRTCWNCGAFAEPRHDDVSSGYCLGCRVLDYPKTEPAATEADVARRLDAVRAAYSRAHPTDAPDGGEFLRRKIRQAAAEMLLEVLHDARTEVLDIGGSRTYADVVNHDALSDALRAIVRREAGQGS